MYRLHVQIKAAGMDFGVILKPAVCMVQSPLEGVKRCGFARTASVRFSAGAGEVRVWRIAVAAATGGKQRCNQKDHTGVYWFFVHGPFAHWQAAPSEILYVSIETYFARFSSICEQL